jgi:hypothetical protein
VSLPANTHQEPGITGVASPCPTVISIWVEQKESSQLFCNTNGQQVYEKMFSITNYQESANVNHNELATHLKKNDYYSKD